MASELFEKGLDLVDKGWELADAGSVDQAIEAFKLAAEYGVADGYIQLARIATIQGDHEAARAWMSKAVDIANQGDAFANLCCSLAYQLGFSQGDIDDLEAKYRFFMRRSAELGHPVAQLILASELLSGANGHAQDENEYEIWISRAIAQGLDEAILAHARNRLDRQRDVEPALMMKLEELAKRSKQAKQLLTKISR